MDRHPIDIFAEQVLPVAKIAGRLPKVRGDRHPHPFTLSDESRV